MRKKIAWLLLITIVGSLLIPPQVSMAVPDNDGDSIALVRNGHAAPIYIDKNSAAYDGIKLVADAVSGDIEAVTDCRPEVVTDAPESDTVIIAGTLDDQLIQDQGLNWAIQPSEDDFKSGQWERYQIQVVTGGEQTKIVVAGSDKRGTSYGLFHISQDLAGVSPWVWWGDVKPQKKLDLIFNKDELEIVSDTPSVKYRGIFLNNESPSLSSYVKEHFGQYNYLFYSNVYELLLRLKANYMWPAMWGNAISSDGVLNIDMAKDKTNLDKLPESERNELANVAIAEDYGIVIGLSHHEPMARAGVEWQRLQGNAQPKYNKQTYYDYDAGGAEKTLTVPLNEWNYFLNNQNIYDFWEDGIKRNGKFNNNLYTIGMRGEGDSALKKPDGTKFTLQESVDLLKKVITDQKKILTEQGHGNDPQALALYTEVQQYWYGYDASTGQTSDALRDFDALKDDIIILCDDNFGYTRFLTYPDERDRNWGMYYHFDMNGGAHSYKWIDTVPLQRIWDNMTMSYDHGVDELWIVNVGDLKPLEVPISYFIDMAYDFDKWGTENPNSSDEYLNQWTQKQFGSELNEEEVKDVAQILIDYADMNGRRKPEILFSDTFSMINYNEAQKELAKAIAMEASADKYRDKLKGTPLEDAYYQLVYYPAAGTATVNKMLIYQGLNQLYAKRGSTVANAYAELVNKMIKRDQELLKYYNDEMSNGKWKLMQNQTNHTMYAGWQDTSGGLPVPSYVTPAPGGTLLVDVPEKEQAFKSGSETSLPDFESTEKQQYPLTLSNGGDASINYKVTADKDWIKFSGTTEGDFYTARTLGVYIDWDQVNEDSTGTINIAAADGEQTVKVLVNAKVIRAEGDEKTYYPSNGVISIGAENYTSKGSGIGTAGKTSEWVRLEDYGKWGQTMRVSPTTEYFDEGNPENGPWLEYKIDVAEEGDYNLIGCFGHSNNLLPESRLKYGVQIDQGDITVNQSITDNFGVAGISGEWTRGTKNSGRLADTSHHLEAGKHTIRIYCIDANVQIQRLVLTQKSLVKKDSNWKGFNDSYYGPDETYYVGKNNGQKPLIYYQVEQSMSVPGNMNAVDCSNEDADRENGVLNAKSSMVYKFPVTVTSAATYLFTVTGNSEKNATAIVKVNGSVAAELKLGNESIPVTSKQGIKLDAGTSELTLEVTEDAKITFISSDLLDTEPGRPMKVSASSNEDEAKNAFDRVNSTGWMPESDDDTPALTMNFGEENYADNITLLGNFSGVTGFTLQTSDDGIEWNDVYVSDHAPDNGQKIYFQGKEAYKGNQWRVIFDNYSDKLKVLEVKLNTFMNWAIEDSGATVTSEGGTLGGSNRTEALIDGNRQGPKNKNAWIVNGAATATVTFGQSRPLTGVNAISVQDSVEAGGQGDIPTDMTFTAAGPKSYTVSYLNDADKWIAMPEFSTNQKVLNYIDFGKSVNAKAVKVTANTSGYVRVMEIEPVEVRKYSTAEASDEYKNWALSENGAAIEAEGTKDGKAENCINGELTSVDGSNRWRGDNTAGASLVITLDGKKTIDRLDLITQQKDDAKINGVYPEPTMDKTTNLGIKSVNIYYWDSKEGDWKLCAQESDGGSKVWQRFTLENPVATDKIKFEFPSGSGLMGYIRVVEVQAWGSEKTVDPENSYPLTVLSGTIKTINDVEIGASEYKVPEGAKVSVSADSAAEGQIFSKWRVLLAPENFALGTPSEATVKFQMPKGDVTLKAEYQKASPSEATPSAAYKADPEGFAYADQESLDDLLLSDNIITEADQDILDKGGKVSVTVLLQRKAVSAGSSLAKKLAELFGDPDETQTAFLMESSLSKQQTEKNGNSKTYSLATASEAVKVYMAIPETWQGMEPEDYRLVHYEETEEGELTAEEVSFDWVTDHQIAFEASVNGTYAMMVPVFYTVTFKDYNGEVLKTLRVKAGESADAPEDPEREGYLFKGWDKEFNEVRKNMTVTAKYIKENTEGGVVERLEGILESLEELDPDDLMEIEGAVQTLIKRVNAVDYSNYTNDGAVMALLEEIENRMVELPGISSPYVDNKSQKISDASVNGALFGLEGKPGYLRIQDVLIPSKLPSGLSQISNAIALDIKLFNEDGSNKPVKGLLKITLDLPETIDTEKEIVVIHYKDGSSDGSFCKYSLSGNQMVLVVDSLSTFTIANVNSETKKTDRDSSGGSGSSVSKKVSAGAWLKDEKGWWYRNTDGSWPKKSWKKISSQGTDCWYYFNEEGYMATGWLQDADGQTYYLEETKDQMEGRMAVGWKLIDGTWYYFNAVSDGTMGALYRNRTTPDGYLVDERGMWTP